MYKCFNFLNPAEIFFHFFQQKKHFFPTKLKHKLQRITYKLLLSDYDIYIKNAGFSSDAEGIHFFFRQCY